jgi:hypothetical protein
MPADLTSAEIAKSGSYFDDATRDPRPYGIENTTDKVRRPGAVRRRRDAVWTERIVGIPYKGPARTCSVEGLYESRKITGIGTASAVALHFGLRPEHPTLRRTLATGRYGCDVADA